LGNTGPGDVRYYTTKAPLHWQPPRTNQPLAPAFFSAGPWGFVWTPAVKQAVAASILYNVHPLMALLPAEQVLAAAGFEEQSACPPAAEPGCPYLRQQPADNHARAVADGDVTRSVLENLEALEKAADVLAEAKKLAGEGRVCEALERLEAVRRLVP